MLGNNASMTSGQLKGSHSFWEYDDITVYGRVHYVNFILPTAILVIYASFWVLALFQASRTPAAATAELEPLLENASAGARYTEEARDQNERLQDRHFSIEHITKLKTNGASHGETCILKPSLAEKTRCAVELLLSVAQIVICTHILINYRNRYPDWSSKNIILQLAQWLALSSLILMRIININYSVDWIEKLPKFKWSICFFAYFWLFAADILPFRSIFIGHISDHLLKSHYYWQFAINSILFLMLFFSTSGDNPSVLYKTDDDITPSPETSTSIANFICWGWIDKFIWKAHLTVINARDVWGLIKDDYSIFVIKRFKKFSSGFKTRRSFSYVLVTFFTPYLLLQAFWATLDSVISFIPTVLLKRILEYVDDQTSTPKNLAWFYVTGMFCCRILVAIAQAQALFFGRRVCVRMKSIIVSEIYNKALRRKLTNEKKDLNTEAGNETPEIDPQKKNDESHVDGDEESSASANLGAIINLMAVDAFKVSEICAYLHTFVEAVFMTITALILLYKLLGWASLVGALLIVLLIPVNYKLTTLMGSYQKKSLKVTDKRIQKLNETFQAIRVVKFFSWEQNFTDEILRIRELELSMLFKRSLVWALSSAVWFLTPTLVTTISFAYYIYVQHEVLTTPVAFTALSLFTLLKNPLDMLASMSSFVIQSKVSLDRIQEFLEEEDTSKYKQLTIDPDANRLSFEHATISWSRENQNFRLMDLNIEFEIGKLNVIIGPTGSGKTSLLMALLGEMELLEGKIVVPSLDAKHELMIDRDGLTNSIAYCSQSAWLLNDTLRNNILFNSPYNEKRYNDVIIACGLKRDLEILSAGDMTEIGEKGITLSGGQKQRVSLARALYSNCKHVLLDDCLSAVDSHTAAWIYDNCITGPLMSNRTCILVSHNVSLTLRNADLVVLIEDGKVKGQGDPVELLNEGFLGEDELIKSSVLSKGASSASLSKQVEKLATKAIGVDNELPTNKQTDQERLKDGKLIEDETKAEGVVGIAVYSWYLHIFGGWKMLSFLFVAFMVAQGSYIAQSWWVRDWVSHTIPSISTFYPSKRRLPNSTELKTSQFIPSTNFGKTKPARFTPYHSTFYYLAIYFLIGLLEAVFASIKTIVDFYAGMRASRKIFKKLLNNVLHSRLRFFDSTPIGRIMNRFSKDIEALDQELVPYLDAAFYCLIECLSTILLITFITPKFLSIAIIVSILYYLVGYFYLSASRELKRLDSITKSPIYQHFSETLVGVATIRAYGDERRFICENLEKTDENNKPFFYLWVANRWLAFRIDIIGALVVFGAGVFILMNIDNLDAGMAGISLTFAISFTEGALWLVRFYSQVEMNMNSVERVQEYMEVEQEPYYDGSVDPPSSWPETGKIEVKDVSLRYAENLPKVIKNVTFNVEPKFKVGIVGRTGAGKSTIITAFFRFLEAETGYIKIDGIDIKNLDLSRLRRSITIIPQDPTLFSGTIKTNLDPYDEFSESEIFEVLKQVNLVTQEELDSNRNLSMMPVQAENVETGNINQFINLFNEIAEGGSNLSQGERQLVCLARSLLRNPKIILLDEATASIDYASDAKIQETIRTVFHNSTILTIAHRLRSVIDYDKILLMDAGEVKEYDHPYSLLLNKNSIFYSMCEQSGELDTLLDMAKRAFVEKLNSK